MTGLERCADCRRICTCCPECTCSALDDTGTMRCHACTDMHDESDRMAELFPADGVGRLATILTDGVA